MKNEKNKVIIIGSSNNYNELGLVRQFGVNGIKPYGIIVCSKQLWWRDWLHVSRYWEKCYRVDTVDAALQLLSEKFENEELKPVVITTMDLVMQKIDGLYNSLSLKFILQSIGGRENGINEVVNKYEQFKLTKSLGFKMLSARILLIDSFIDDEIPDLDFPVLLKPVQGGEGSKGDIKICKNRFDFNCCMKELKEKDYNRVLCQKYLEDREEFLVHGAMNGKGGLSSYTILKNIRQWPLHYGIGSYSKFVTDKEWIEFVGHLFVKLMEYGYDGLIDVELFLDKKTNEVYINEYNWRSSGRNFTALGTKVYSAVLWYLVKIGEPIDKFEQINYSNGYAIYENLDFNHVKINAITKEEWKKDYNRSCAYALHNKHDIKPSIIPSLYRLKNKLLRRK